MPVIQMAHIYRSAYLIFCSRNISASLNLEPEVKPRRSANRRLAIEIDAHIVPLGHMAHKTSQGRESFGHKLFGPIAC